MLLKVQVSAKVKLAQWLYYISIYEMTKFNKSTVLAGLKGPALYIGLVTDSLTYSHTD